MFPIKTDIQDIQARQRRPRRSRNIKKGRVLVTLVGILILGWFFVSGVKSLLYNSLIEAGTFEPGIVTQDITTMGVLIKQEYLIAAPLNGTVEYSLTDGQRVKAGSTFGVIKAPSMATTSGISQSFLRAPVSGVLCNHLDGLETILTPGNLDVVEIPALDKIEEGSSTRGTAVVENGQPVAKVIDNLAPIYLYGTVDKETFQQIQDSEEHIVKLNWESQVIEAKVEKLRAGDQPSILFSIKNYPDEILHNRKLNATIQVESLEGFLVPEESLVTKDNQVGLYLVWKGLIRWFPVEVTGRLRGQAAIIGEGVQPGVRYIVNPRYAREGDKL